MRTSRPRSITRAAALSTTAALVGSALALGGTSAASAVSLTSDDYRATEAWAPVGSSNLRDVAVAEGSGSVYIGDTVSKSIREYTSAGQAAEFPLSGWASQIVIDQSTETVYALLGNTNQMAIIHNGVSTEVNVGSNPQTIAVDQTSGIVYVGTYGGQSVSIYDHGVLTSVPVGIGVYDIGIDESTGTAYALTDQNGSVVVIEDGAVTETIVVDGGAAGYDDLAIDVDQKTHTAWISSQSGDLVLALSGSTKTRYSVGDGPLKVAVNQENGTVYTNNYLDNTVSVISDGRLSSIAAPGVRDIIVNSDTGTVFLPMNNDGKVMTLNGETLGALTLPEAQLGPAALDPATDSLYIIRGSSSMVVDRIAPGSGVVPLSIRSSNAPVATSTGAFFYYSVPAAGGPALRYRISGGQLPQGLSLHPRAGVITGTPTLTGTFAFTVEASTGSGTVVSAPYSISVGGFTSASPVAGRPGVSYSHQIYSTVNAPFLLESGELPPGLTLASSGLISGVPTTSGEYTFTVAQNNFGPFGMTSVRMTYTLVIEDLKVSAFLSGQPVAAALGDAYEFQFAASGFPRPTYTVSSGALPSGLNLDSDSGFLTGTPDAPGLYTFSITASNRVNGELSTKTARYSIAVSGAAQLVTTATVDGVVGSPYSLTLAATGYPLPEFAVNDGALPAGLTLDSATGVVSGVPTVSGRFSATVSAFNEVGTDSLGDLEFVVRDAAAVAVSSSRSTQVFGTKTPATVTALVSAIAGDYPTGDVVFTDGSTTLGTVAVDASGKAKVLLAATAAVGSHTITARFVPDAELVIGTSVTKKITVTKATSKTAIKLASSTVKKGKTTKVSATVTVVGVASPTGTVTAYVKGKKVASASLKATAKGKVTLTLPKSSKTGTVKVVLKYAGTTSITGSTSATKSLKVTK